MKPLHILTAYISLQRENWWALVTSVIGGDGVRRREELTKMLKFGPQSVCCTGERLKVRWRLWEGCWNSICGPELGDH